MIDVSLYGVGYIAELGRHRKEAQKRQGAGAAYQNLRDELGQLGGQVVRQDGHGICQSLLQKSPVKAKDDRLCAQHIKYKIRRVNEV